MINTNIDNIPKIANYEKQTFVRFYKSLNTSEEGIIRLFERVANGNNYYTLHGEDAHYIANTLYQSTTVIQYWSGDKSKGLATIYLTKRSAKMLLRNIFFFFIFYS